MIWTTALIFVILWQDLGIVIDPNRHETNAICQWKGFISDIFSIIFLGWFMIGFYFYCKYKDCKYEKRQKETID